MAANRYQHSIPPEDYRQLLEYIERELAGISSSIDSIENGDHDILYNPPIRVRPGMVVYADGVEWDPGSGEGLYRYSLSGTWVFIG